MGWMNDTLRYIELDPVYRRYNHHLITFSFVYAWSENFILPISHDEVVHGKRSLLDKMPGDVWQKRANLRLLLAFMTAHPGKKLMFMGSEFGQWQEWRDYEQLDWALLEDPAHRGLQDLVRDLNHLYSAAPQFHGSDSDHEGFRWVELHNADDSVWAFERRSTGNDKGAPYMCIFNATPVPRDQYAFGVGAAGEYRKVLDTDDHRYGGSGYNRQSAAYTSALQHHGNPFTLKLDLPPLGAMFFLGPH
jgi:1,4-alpha-glucan branching enzyme